MAEGIGGKWWYPVAVTVVGMLLTAWFVCRLCGGGSEGREALDLAKKIHTYLGTNVGGTRTGLIGNIDENNEFHREQYKKIGCSLWKLEHPGQPEPTPCPPGGPASRPVPPPNYP